MSKSLILLFIALMLLVPLISISFIIVQTRQSEQTEFSNLETIAKLKTEQIESWLRERRGDCETLIGSINLMNDIKKLIQHPDDPDKKNSMSNRLDLLRSSYDYESVLLVDTQGNLLLGKGNHLDVSPVVQTLLAQSIADKQIMHTDLYREESGHIHMDWIVPIIARPDSGEHVIAAIVLRVDPHRFLYSMIQTWPTRSDSAETLLVRKEDHDVLYLNELPHLKGTALVLKKPLSTSALPAAVAVQTDQPGMMQGRDYRRVEVLAAYRPIAGTDWHIVAQIYRAELLKPMWQTLKWIVAIALVAALSIFLAFWMLLRKQGQLQKLEVEAEKTSLGWYCH